MPPQPKQPSAGEAMARTVRGWGLHPAVATAVQDIGLAPTTLISRVLGRTTADFADSLIDSRSAIGSISTLGTAEMLLEARGKRGAAQQQQPLYLLPAAVSERHNLIALFACHCLLSLGATPIPPTTTTTATTTPAAALPAGYRGPGVVLVVAQSDARAEQLREVAADLADCCGGIDVSVATGGGSASGFAPLELKQALRAVENAQSRRDGDAGGARGTIVITTRERYASWAKQNSLSDLKVLVPPAVAAAAAAASSSSGNTGGGGGGDEDGKGERASEEKEKEKEKEKDGSEKGSSAGSHSSAAPEQPQPLSGPAWSGVQVVALLLEDVATLQGPHEPLLLGMVRAIAAANARFKKLGQLFYRWPTIAAAAATSSGSGGNAASSSSSSTLKALGADRDVVHMWLCMAPLVCIAPTTRAVLSRRSRRYYPLLPVDPATRYANDSRVSPSVAQSPAATHPTHSLFVRLLLKVDEKDGRSQLRTLLQQTHYFKKVAMMTHTREIAPLHSTVASWGVNVGPGELESSTRTRVFMALRQDRPATLTERMLQWLYGTSNASVYGASGTDAGNDSNSNNNGNVGKRKRRALAEPAALVMFDGSPIVDVMDADCLIQMNPPQKSLLAEEWASFIQCLHTTGNGELEIEAHLLKNTAMSRSDIARSLDYLHEGLSVSKEVADGAIAARRPCVLVICLGTKDFSLASYFLKQYHFSGATGEITAPATAAAHTAAQISNNNNNSNKKSSGGSGGGGGSVPPALLPSVDRSHVPVLNVAHTHPLFVPLLSCEAERAFGRPLQERRAQTEDPADSGRAQADLAKARATIDAPPTVRNVLRAKLDRGVEAAARAGGWGHPQDVAILAAAASRQQQSSNGNNNSNSSNSGGKGGGGGGAGALSQSPAQGSAAKHQQQQGKGKDFTATAAAARRSPATVQPSPSSSKKSPASPATATASSPPATAAAAQSKSDGAAAVSSSSTAAVAAPKSSTAATVSGLLHKMGLAARTAPANPKNE